MPGRFDLDRPNNFDLLRFLAASLVLTSHAWSLNGKGPEPGVLGYETLGGIAVGVFFVVSGFLVTASWQRAPRVTTFATKRALRILPGFVTVIALAALVLGPVFTPLRPGEYFAHPQFRGYFLNLTFAYLQYPLPAVFMDNPYPHAINGSLWTLPLEVLMYAVLAVLGALGLVRRRAVTLIAVGLALAWFLAAPTLRQWPQWPVDTLGPASVVQLGLWFFTGSACWLWRDRLRFRLDLALALLGVAVLLSGTAAAPVAAHAAVPYAVLAFAQADLGPAARFGRYGDFSYGMYLYAFPVQQVLAHWGSARWPLPLAIAAAFVVTLACAVLSWRLIEAPALRHKRRRASLTMPTPALSH